MSRILHNNGWEMDGHVIWLDRIHTTHWHCRCLRCPLSVWGSLPQHFGMECWHIVCENRFCWFQQNHLTSSTLIWCSKVYTDQHLVKSYCALLGREPKSTCRADFFLHPTRCQKRWSHHSFALHWWFGTTVCKKGRDKLNMMCLKSAHWRCWKISRAPLIWWPIRRHRPSLPTCALNPVVPHFAPNGSSMFCCKQRIDKHMFTRFRKHECLQKW